MDNRVAPSRRYYQAIFLQPRSGDILVVDTYIKKRIFQTKYTMANTYSQVHLQFIFALKYRAALIKPAWEDELYKYMTGVVQRNDHKMLCVNGMPDHVHLLIGFRTTQSIADLMKDVKNSSSGWINKKGFCASYFEWQRGYGAFSYSKPAIKTGVNYILNLFFHHTSSWCNIRKILSKHLFYPQLKII